MPEVWRQLTQNWPALQSLWDALIIAASLSSLLACAGLFFMSAAAKIIGVSQKRNSYEKCSRQLACLALWLGWIILACARIWLYFTQGARPESSLSGFLAEMSWLLLSMGVLLGTIYYFLWKTLKNMPVLHATIGVLAAVQNCLALACVIFAIRVIAPAANPDLMIWGLPPILPEAWEASAWSCALYTAPAVFGFAGGFALAWLALRRKKDDFGRDYYIAMPRWCAAWAKNSWLVLLLFLFCAILMKALQAHEPSARDIESLVYDSCAFLILTVPAALWRIIQKSAVPMRARLLMYLAPLIAMSFTIPYFLEIISL